MYNWWWAWCWLWCGCCSECWCWCWWGCWCCSVGCLALNLTLPASELPLPWVPTTLGVSDSSSSSAPRLRNLTNPSSSTSIVEPVVGVCSWIPPPPPCCTGVCLPRLSEFLRVCIPLPCRFNEPRPSCGKWPMVPDLRMECLSKVPATTTILFSIYSPMLGKEIVCLLCFQFFLFFFRFVTVRGVSRLGKPIIWVSEYAEELFVISLVLFFFGMGALLMESGYDILWHVNAPLSVGPRKGLTEKCARWKLFF